MEVRNEDVAETAPFLEGSRRSSTTEQMSIFEEELKHSHTSRRLRLPSWSGSHSLFFQHFLQLATWFIPSFLRKSTSKTDKPLHETAYLDGLRGYACYSVFIAHYLIGFTYEQLHVYGEGSNLHGVKTNYIFQLPIIRLFAHGQAAIAIFFVMSGYVLSYKSHKLMHSHQFDSLHACLSSSIFRRWLRLFLPVIGLFLANFVLVEVGGFDWTTKFIAEHKPEKHLFPVYPDYPLASVESYLGRGKGFGDTIRKFYRDWIKYNVAVLWEWHGAGKMPDMDGHLWTLHIEFRSSCILFLCLAGTSRMTPPLRLTWFILASIICLYNNEWAIATFLMGSVLAGIDFRMRLKQNIQDPSSLLIMSQPPHTPHIGQSRLQLWWRSNWGQVLYTLLFILGLLLISWPRLGVPSNSYFYLPLKNLLLPKTGVNEVFFFVSLGAPLVVYTAGCLRPLSRALSSPFSQYIGKTSFALYLVHGTVNKAMSFYFVVHALRWTGYEGVWFGVGVVGPFLFVVLPTVVICTDWFWRGVDLLSVRVARWIEGVCTDKTI